MERTTTSTTETKAIQATARTAGSGSRGRSTVDRLMELQSLIGNRPAGLILQAELSVSQPSDPSEKEADDVAERVLNLSDSAARSGSAPNKCGKGQTLQRKCAGCEEESRQEADSGALT